MESSDDVVLLGNWGSVFVSRVRIALAEKGVNYEYRKEDLSNKSQPLLEMNPVHKKYPVLIHGGKPVCESNIIVQYIDETWHDKSPSLFPADLYLKVQAKFWADFIDKKVQDTGTKMAATKGEEQVVPKKEFIDLLNLLEKQIGDKPYLVGDSFGYADIALIPFTSRFYTLEKMGNLSIEKESPKLFAWVKRCMERESVSKALPDPIKVFESVLEKHKKKPGQ